MSSSRLHDRPFFVAGRLLGLINFCTVGSSANRRWSVFRFNVQGYKQVLYVKYVTSYEHLVSLPAKLDVRIRTGHV